ncbi:MAG: hypothetical protein RLZ55_186, partial [Actinomycetota bacterium]
YNQLPREELIGSTVMGLLPAHKSSGLLDRYIAVIETGEPLILDDFVYPHEILAEPRRFDIRAVKVGDAMSFTWRDVTERSEAAAQMAASEERLRVTLEAQLDPHVILEAVRDDAGQVVDFEYTDANAAALAYAGLAREALVGARALELLPGQSGSDLLGRFVSVVDTGESLSLNDFAYALELRGGQIRWLDIRAVRVGDGLSYSWRDVTDRHEAQTALAEAQKRYRLLAQNASDVVFTAGPDRLITWVSPNVTDTLGWGVDDMVGRVAADFVHPGDAGAAAPALAQVYAERSETAEFDFKMRWRTSTDSYVWMLGRTTRLLTEDGRLDYVVAGLSDISDEVAVQERLAASEEYLNSVLDAALDPHIMFTPVIDADGRVVDLTYADLNPAACVYLRTTRDAVLGRRLFDLYRGESSQTLLGWCTEALRTAAPVVLDDQCMVSQVTDATSWFDVRAVPLNGQVSLTFRNVTDRHRESVRVAASEEKFRLIAENATDAVLHARDGIMVWLSPSLTTLLGWAPQEWVGHRFEEFTHPEDVALAQQRRAEINAGATRITRLRLRDTHDQYHWVEIHASPFADTGGNPDGIVASFRTIDAQIQAEKVLRDRARYDDLTGLLNRAEVFHRLQSLLSQQPRTGTEVAVAFCDLDGFKEINDTYGHQMGDHVLKACAEHIRALLREDDWIARIGGDEILLVLTGVHDLDSAAAVAEKVRHHTAQPHRYLDTTYTPKMSIGVTLLRRDEQPDDVIARADRAMYAAKKAGGNKVIAT